MKALPQRALGCGNSSADEQDPGGHSGSLLDLEHGAQVLDGFVERATGRRIVERADVLREERLVAARHADRVLEEGANGQHRRTAPRQPDRRRRVAARPPHERGYRARGRRARVADDTVVATNEHVAIVNEQRVGKMSRDQLVKLLDSHL